MKFSIRGIYRSGLSLLFGNTLVNIAAVVLVSAQTGE